jgi:hypothetical protein
MGLGDVLPLPFSARRRARFIHCASSILNSNPIQNVKWAMKNGF